MKKNTSVKVWQPLLAVLLTCFCATATFCEEPVCDENKYQRFHHDNVLGTSLTLTVAASPAQAQAVEQNVLAEIKRLEKIFSHYDQQSEISRVNNAEDWSAYQPSPELKALLGECEHWQQQMPTGFSCKMGDVIQAWQNASASQIRPDRKEIRALARRAVESDYGLAQLLAGEPNEHFRWNLGGIAKGYILDQTMAVVRKEFSDIQAIAIDIGGDSVYWQAEPATAEPWRVALVKPHSIDDSGENTLGQLTLSQGAVAYSGHGSRARTIGNHNYSHILAPRDGWPGAQSLSVVVKAPTATQADAAATGLAAMHLAEALDWLAQQTDIDALIINEDDRQYASNHWYDNFIAADETKQLPIMATIQFSLPDIKAEQYRRPYVAVWIADANNQIVKNLLLLGDRERWMSENRYWWRRQGRSDPGLLLGLARPTRRAGEYQLTWDGRDDYGKVLATGEYSLWMEAAREHGDHERIAIKFVLGENNILGKDKVDLTKAGEKEIQQLRLQVNGNAEQPLTGLGE